MKIQQTRTKIHLEGGLFIEFDQNDNSVNLIQHESAGDEAIKNTVMSSSRISVRDFVDRVFWGINDNYNDLRDSELFTQAQEHQINMEGDST